jgi:hypothetical protein
MMMPNSEVIYNKSNCMHNMSYKTMKTQHNNDNTNRDLSNSNTSLELCSYCTPNNNIKLVLLARFEACTAVLLKIQAFWDVTVSSSRHSLMFQNISNYTSNDKVSQPRRIEYCSSFDKETNGS